MSDLSEQLAKVEAAVKEADSIGFDGCHKIYVLMDAESTADQIGFGYREDDSSHMLLRSEGATDEQMLEKLRDWYSESCGLRFITAVKAPGDNSDYTDLIAQFEDGEDV